MSNKNLILLDKRFFLNHLGDIAQETQIVYVDAAATYIEFGCVEKNEKADCKIVFLQTFLNVHLYY